MSCLSLRGSTAVSASRPLAAHRPVLSSRRPVVAARASRDSGDSFTAGFLVGGVICGALGFLLAPQISKSLSELPKLMEEEEKNPEQTKQELIDKIAQLNKSIDDVASSLKPVETVMADAEAVPSS